VDAEPGETARVTPLEITTGKKLLRHRAEGVDGALVWLNSNTDCLVELTLVTETFMTASERRQLNAAHDGIVAIIPEVKNSSEISGNKKKTIDLSQNMEALFLDYFKYKKGQDPNDELMLLFSEILAEEDEK